MTRSARARQQVIGAMTVTAGFGASFGMFYLVGIRHVSTAVFATCFTLIAALMAADIILFIWIECRRAQRDADERALWAAIKAVMRPTPEEDAK